MRRCPECNSLFPDTEHFCEQDGMPLVTMADDLDAVLKAKRAGQPQSQASQKILAILAVAGVSVGVIVVLVYLGMTRETAQDNSEQPNSNSTLTAQQVLPPPPLRPVPGASASPSLEPTPSPSVQPSASPQSSAAERVELSSSPISTAAGSTGKTGPVIIRLNSGLNIDADEAWHTGEGIWYRRRGVVTLLDPKDVKTIEKPPPPKPQSTSSPAPTPSPAP